MKKSILCFFIASFLTLVSAFSADIPVNPPAKVHPRLLFTSEKLEIIKEKFSHPENKNALDEYNYLIDYSSTKDSELDPKEFNKRIAQIEAMAFQYALTKKTEFALSAYDEILFVCKNFSKISTYDMYRPAGKVVFTISEIYDWCYDALDSKQKKKLYSSAMNLIETGFQIGWPPEKQGPVNGHGCEAQLLQNLLAFAIAVYDEKADVWDKVASRFYRSYVPVRKFVYDSKLPSFQGTSYGLYRCLFDAWSAILIRGFGGKDPYDEKISNWSHSLLYFEINPEYFHLPLGDGALGSNNELRVSSIHFMTGNLYNDGYAKTKALKTFSKYTGSDIGKKSHWNYSTSLEQDGLISPVQYLILNNPEILLKPVNELPLVQYNPSPMGSIVMRGSWTDLTSPLVYMKGGELYSSNHEHKDAGSFAIFEENHISNQGALYVSGVDFKSPYNLDFYHNSINSNTIVFDNGRTIANQKPCTDGISDEEAKKWVSGKSESHNRAKVIAHNEKQYDDKTLSAYLSCNLKNAYDVAKKAKRKMFSFIDDGSENRLIFIVCDDVEGTDDYKGVQLFQMNKEPEFFEKNVFCVPNKTSILGQVLLPEKSEISVSGGDNRTKVKNTKYENTGSVKKYKKQFPFENWGRLEIRKKSDKKEANSETRFITVYVTGKNFKGSENLSKVKAELIKGEDFDCVRVKDLIVYFEKDGKKCDISKISKTEGKRTFVCADSLKDGFLELQ